MTSASAEGFGGGAEISARNMYSSDNVRDVRQLLCPLPAKDTAYEPLLLCIRLTRPQPEFTASAVERSYSSCPSCGSFPLRLSPPISQLPLPSILHGAQFPLHPPHAVRYEAKAMDSTFVSRPTCASLYPSRLVYFPLSLSLHFKYSFPTKKHLPSNGRRRHLL